VIGFLFAYKIIFFSFLPSMQLKHVILIPTADIVLFSSHVLASHVMHYFCVADSVLFSCAMCVLFMSDSVSYFLSQSPIFTAGKISSAGE
jgi:uncharacterized membrane protein